MQASQNSSSIDATKTVDTFIQHRAPEIHPAWDSKNADVVFGNTIGKLEKRSAARLQFTQVAADSTTRLKDIIKHFNLNNNSKATKVVQRFSTFGKNTWVEVQAEAEAAWDIYEQKRIRNWFRTAAGTVGNRAPALQSWLEVIPSNEYTSIACGALKIIFATCAVSSKFRDKVREALDSTAELMDQTSRWLRFISDPDLNDKAEQLYIAILEGTEAVLCWLDSGTFKEAVKAFLKQDNYGKNIDDSLAVIRVKSEAFSQMVNTLSQEATFRIERRLSELNSSFTAKFNNMEQKQSVQIGTLEQLLWSRAVQALWYPQNIIFNLSVKPERQSITAEQLQVALDVNPNILENDLSEIIDSRDTGQSRAMKIVQDTGFQSWFTSADSKILVVDDLAREESLHDNAPTTLTSLSARLIYNLRTLGLGIPLFFFCNPHTQPIDPLGGPLGMMKALNHQLLEQFRGFNLSFIDYGLFHRIHGSEPLDQWDLFQKTIQNTRPMVLFCIIDGLSEFDNGLHGDDVADLAHRFQQLVHNLNGSGPEFHVGPILKILVTVPQMGVTSAGWFKDAEVIYVPEYGFDMIDGIEDIIMAMSMQDMQSGV